MCYSILVENIASKFFGGCGEGDWENMTWDVVSNDDDSLRDLYESAGYGDDEYKKLDDEEKVIYIRETEEFYELSEGYYPILNYVHVLQEKPTEEDILKIHKNAPNIVIIGDDLGNFFIGISAAGMDFSEELAYAYMVIDFCVPPCFRIDEDSNYTLNKEAHKELVEFLSKNDDVNFRG